MPGSGRAPLILRHARRWSPGTGAASAAGGWRRPASPTTRIRRRPERRPRRGGGPGRGRYRGAGPSLPGRTAGQMRIRRVIIELRALRQAGGGKRGGAARVAAGSCLRPDTPRPACARFPQSEDLALALERPAAPEGGACAPIGAQAAPSDLRNCSDPPARRGGAETPGLASPACGSSSYAKLPGVGAALDNRNETVMECRPFRTTLHDLDLSIPRACPDEPGGAAVPWVRAAAKVTQPAGEPSKRRERRSTARPGKRRSPNLLP